MPIIKRLVSWIIWLMVPPFVMFIMSFVFDFPYFSVVRSNPFTVIYTIACVIFTIFFIVVSDEDELNFFK